MSTSTPAITRKCSIREVAKKFLDGWKHPHKTKPTVKNIFYVAYSTKGLEHLAKFSDYSNRVGNTQMLFHGTRRACRIAEYPTNVTACSRNDCNLCNILRGSYNMERAKGARMFGPGIYSTLVSSKADDYSTNSDTTLRTRVMIVNHVALGRSKTMYEASHDMQHAPHLYNSVTAATYPEGGKVNYHEAVVYREDAICANAIVIYSV
ncbi:hypothetical protein CVT26_011028 [Gymnopilus dilepis]|uniref:PARP catalytic domain-containing protein n=1 Tax=Gymnopilus dilepis TaxID=231916 RepID=A0A409VY40_9AGAR|nr:hypothetical protein CVT26_011028 [Gymnopilus dilepis]